MSKHTQGPWKKGILGGTIISESSNGIDINGAIGEDAVKYYGGNLICESVSECNRGLIAAAPDLLEVLKEAKLQIEYLDEKFVATGTTSAVLARINAAIAKAEGGAE
jgi:hypothetical protein